MSAPVVKLLPPSGGGMFLVSLSTTIITKFQGELSQRGFKYTGLKNCNFQSKSLFVSETVQDRPVIAVDH